MASIPIGVVVAVSELGLVEETKDLLIGEQASKRRIDRLAAIPEEKEGVDRVNGTFATHLSPEQIVDRSVWSSTTLA